MLHPKFLSVCLCTSLLLSAGCSVKKVAINKLGDSLAKSSTTYSSDNDPELVGEALPFSLKLIEGLLAESPKHKGLLFAASSGFTQYSYVYVQEQADELESKDLTHAAELRLRARNLYLRARNYGLRGLEARHPGFKDALQQNPRAAAKKLGKAEVPEIFWTAVSWAAVMSVSKDKPELLADQAQVSALVDRAAELDPDFDNGAIEGFLISYEPARQDAKGDSAQRCRSHFERAVALSNGQMAGHYVALAEAVMVQKQDRVQFDSLLRRAIAVDPDARPEWRLSNLVYQRRARWLLSQEDELFLQSPETPQRGADHTAAQERKQP
jgi:predicted anti-sigma-YlaC factor YlaD